MPRSSSSSPPRASTDSSSTPHAGLRQSCNRCYAQKLRCVRVDGVEKSHGVCQRCTRQQVKCVYSACAPKGRPRIGRTALQRSLERDLSGHRSSPKLSLEAATTAPTTTLSAAALTTPSDSALNESTASRPLSLGGCATSTEADDSLQSPLSGELTAPEIQQPQMWPPIPDSIDLGWNELDVDFDQWFPQSLQAADAGQTGFDSDMREWTSHTLGIFDSNLDEHASELGVVDTSSGSSLSRANIQPIVSTENCSGNTTGDTSHIAELTQLNLRLCIIHRSVTAFTLSGCQRPGPVIDMAALTVVMDWTSQASKDLRQGHLPVVNESKSDGVGIALREIFSASCELIRILSILLSDPSIPCANNSSTVGVLLSPDAIDQIMGGTFRPRHPPIPPSSTPSRSPSKTPSTGESSLFETKSPMIDQLIIACAVLLLNILLVVLDIIQNDIGRDILPTPMANLRTILGTQICSYFIDRQNLAVDLYLSSVSLTTQRAQSQDPDRIPTPADSGLTASLEELAKLREDIQQRFVRLRHFLPM